MANNLNDLKLGPIRIKINYYIEEIRIDEEIGNG